ncbi:MAG: nucleoid occlusion factor SlmA [Lautropia sp.]|nr:nucleoid occlusion factor SlmA [Lautropia sp.]
MNDPTDHSTSQPSGEAPPPSPAGQPADAAGSGAVAPAAGAAAAAGTEGDGGQARRPVRKRPKPGERRLQILQALAEMLEQPRGDRVTTAALAARLSVSEAALYRHFASKAQMFEGLIEFIESTLFGLINQITRDEENGLAQVQQIVSLLLTFSERNPGMTRVLVGDALINEDERLQVRINQLIDRLELSVKQCYRTAAVQGGLPADADAGAHADLLMSYVLGRWMRYAKGGFKRMPTESMQVQLARFVG